MHPQDPAFPTVHVRPAAGWVNDPNGPVRWSGRYHLFFQHNPAGPLHGEICWGHASSPDLVTWTVQPVALVPSPDGPDSGGCWSGCVVGDDGVATAVYTGIVDDPRTATVCLAYAADDGLRHWRKDPEPVASPPEGTEWTAFRDPFLLTVDGHRYAVVGAGTSGEPGAGGGAAEVLVYGCDDLQRWDHQGALLTGDDPVAAALAPAEIWECPQLFPLPGRNGPAWVLVLSLVRGDALTRVAYLVGALEAQDGTLRFVPETGGLVDSGHDFYAPAVLVGDDRVLLWGWTWEDRDPADVLVSGWAGALTWPRVLGLTDDGRLTSAPAPELAALRGPSTTAELSPSGSRLTLPRGPVEVELDLDAEGPARVRLTNGQASLVLEVDPEAGRVRLSRTPFESFRQPWLTEGPMTPDPCARLRLVVDGSVVEVYVQDGPVFTERLYPTATGVWELTAEGVSGHATVHALRPAVSG